MVTMCPPVVPSLPGGADPKVIVAVVPEPEME